jgi:tetratricopeptide (TPR) repeat protein
MSAFFGRSGRESGARGAFDRSRSFSLSIAAHVGLLLGAAPFTSPRAIAADPPAGPSTVFVNDLSRLSTRHLEHYVPFHFSLPQGWVAGKKAGTEESANVVQFQRRQAIEGDDFLTQESFAVGELVGVGTGEISRQLVQGLCAQMSEQLAAGFPSFKSEPDVDMTFAGLSGHGFDFRFYPETSDPKGVAGWGRLVLIPGPAFDSPRGLTILMFGTTAAPELKAAADFGVKGELPTIIGSFKTGRPKQSPEETAAEIKRLLDRVDSYLGEPTYPYENADRAAIMITEAIRLAPKDPKLLVRRASIADRRLNQSEQSLADLNAAVELAPADAEVRIARARKLLKIGKEAEAKLDVDEALRVAPQTADAHAALAEWNSDYKNEKHDAAIAAYDEAIRLDPKRAEYHLGRALAWEKKGGYDRKHDDRALADYDVALGLDPKLEHALQNRAHLHEQNGRLKEAVRDLDALVEHYPLNRRTRERRAVLLVRAGQFDRAIPELDELLKFANPREPETYQATYYVARGDAYYGKQDYEKAGPDYLAAMHFPQYSFLRFERPELVISADELKTRLAAADEGVKLAPTDPEARGGRGMLRYIGRDFAGAVEDLEVSNSPEKATFFSVSLRGFAKLHLFRDKEARDDFLAAKKLFEADKQTEPFKEVREFEDFIDTATADIEQRRGKPPAK